VLTWGIPDPTKAELVIQDIFEELWDYTGPIQKFRAQGEGNAIKGGDIYTGRFE